MSDEIDAFKDENIEITSSSKVIPDEEAEAEAAVKGPVDPALEDALTGVDDELDSDKMDYESEEPDML